VFFDSVAGITRVFVVGTLAYIELIVLLRISGNRTLAKMNAFDFIVTVALGSTLATILLSDKVALAEGVVAFIVLIGLQYIVTWLSVRSSRFSDLVKSQPILLYYDGKLLHGQMRQARVVKPEILSAVRKQGIASLDEVKAVVLETDGSFAIVKASDIEPTALMDVSGDEATHEQDCPSVDTQHGQG